MTDEQLERRAEIYFELIEFEPFKFLVKEMNKDIEELKEAVINDLTDERLVDKALVWGIRKVINTPYQAIEESDKHNLNENS